MTYPRASGQHEDGVCIERGLPPGEYERLIAAIRACKAAQAPSRALDARIAIAAFPALAGFPAIDEAVWRHDDGSRVRALRYSSSRTAAATLVMPGHWIEPRDGSIAVVGAAGEWSGVHEVEEIALCLAALRARLPRPL